MRLAVSQHLSLWSRSGPTPLSPEAVSSQARQLPSGNHKKNSWIVNHPGRHRAGLGTSSLCSDSVCPATCQAPGILSCSSVLKQVVFLQSTPENIDIGTARTQKKKVSAKAHVSRQKTTQIDEVGATAPLRICSSAFLLSLPRTPFGRHCPSADVRCTFVFSDLFELCSCKK